MDNLAHVLAPTGERPDDKVLEEFVERGFRNYGHYWAEGAKLPALSRSTISERFTIAEGVEHLYAAKERGQGIIIALPHIGSWEWGGAYLHLLDLTMTAVAEVLEPPELFAWFKKKRESIGIHVAALDEHAGTVLLSTLRRGGVVGLLCDRDIQGNGIDVEFFGERVAMPAGPATLALRTGATLVAAACYTGPGRDHFAVVTPPIEIERTRRLRDDVTQLTQSVTRELEGLIRRAPEQWHVLESRFPVS
jgi:lauroyl/myristoyl acyltransferase